MRRRLRAFSDVGRALLVFAASVVNAADTEPKGPSDKVRQFEWVGLGGEQTPSAMVSLEIEGAVTAMHFEIRTPAGTTAILESRFDPGLDSIFEELRFKGSGWKCSLELKTGLVGLEPAYKEWDSAAASEMTSRLAGNEAIFETIVRIGKQKFIVREPDRKKYQEELVAQAALRLESAPLDELREAIRFLAAANSVVQYRKADPFAIALPDALVQVLDAALDVLPSEKDYLHYRKVDLRSVEVRD